MSYPEEWQLLSGHITGLLKAAELHARFLSIRSDDSSKRTERLRQSSLRVVGAIKQFAQAYRDALPAQAVAHIEDFLNYSQALIESTDGIPESREERVWAALVVLGAFEAELSLRLADNQHFIRSRAERAFEHLQRSIVVDQALRSKWQDAFARGETDCEALGAVHLLSHGIWAFKVNGAGERTDLLYQDVIEDMAPIQRSSDGLVLTEWKKAKLAKDLMKRYEEARGQSLLYVRGVLGGIELALYRYLVVVSEKRVEAPADTQTDGITYRHINIAINPDTPSRDARAVARSSSRKR